MASETYPVSEPSGTDLTNVGLGGFNTSLIGTDDGYIHHRHGVAIAGESLGRLTKEGLGKVYEGVL